jgi:hypothetical protein
MALKSSRHQVTRRSLQSNLCSHVRQRRQLLAVAQRCGYDPVQRPAIQPAVGQVQGTQALHARQRVGQRIQGIWEARVTCCTHGKETLYTS